MKGADDIRRRIESLELEAEHHERLAKEAARGLARELSEYAEAGNLYGFTHLMACDGSIKSHLRVSSLALEKAAVLRSVLGEQPEMRREDG